MLLEQIDRIFQLDAEERRRLAALEQQPKWVFRPGKDLFRPGEPVRHTWLIHKGWATWHEILPDGDRQIFAFYLAGDIVGLPWAVMEAYRNARKGSSSVGMFSLHVTALTEVQAVPLEVDVLDHIFERRPSLNTVFSASVSVGITNSLQRHLTNMGRRSAQARLANLFVELWERQQRNGMAQHGSKFELPISQSVLADALGLTPVHVSRVMSQLVDAGVLSTQKRPRNIVVHDRARLYEIAGITEHSVDTMAAVYS